MKQKILVSAALVALSVSLAAQSTFTTPAGYDAKSSGSSANNWGLYYTGGELGRGQVVENAVVHITNPDMPTGKATLTQLEYRSVTDRTYYLGNGQPRTINSFALTLGYAAKVVDRTFSTNWVGSPTTVYTATKLSLPGFTSGNPKQTWGNMGRFPFANSFMWDSTKGEMLMEFKSKSGKLANAGGRRAEYYLQDAVWSSSIASVFPSPASSAVNRYLPRYHIGPSDGGCRDTAAANTARDAVAYVGFNLYSDLYSVTNWRGKYRISQAWTILTAPKKPVLAILSVGGSDVGIPVSARCNRLHVNVQFPLRIMSGFADSTGRTHFINTPGGFWSAYTKYDNEWAGIALYWQAAYDDTKSKALSLTSAMKLVLPKKPVLRAPVKLAVEYAEKGKTGRQGLSLTSAEGWYNPTERWTAK